MGLGIFDFVISQFRTSRVKPHGALGFRPFAFFHEALWGVGFSILHSFTRPHGALDFRPFAFFS